MNNGSTIYRVYMVRVYGWYQHSYSYQNFTSIIYIVSSRFNIYSLFYKVCFIQTIRKKTDTFVNNSIFLNFIIVVLEIKPVIKI